MLIGLISFLIIYNRLAGIPHLKDQVIFWLSNPKIIGAMILALFFMPINWGIECYKWKLITHQIEPISYKTSIKSVLTGICLGNIAPGRSMEFIAKIFFFKSENRPSITILHFINGMFQMLITITIGTCAIIYKFNHQIQSSLIFYVIILGGVILAFIFCFAIFNISYIQRRRKFIKWFKWNESTKALFFSRKLILQLFSLSICRNVVFTFQFYLIYTLLSGSSFILQTITSIAGYFMLTSIIPMISLIEPAIRAAIALFVFDNYHDGSLSIVLSSTFLWLINVILPSLMGFIIILKEKIDFKSKHVI